VKTCKSLGKGELDFYTTLEELEASWNNRFLRADTENYTTQGNFDVWIPFMRNPETDNYESTSPEIGPLDLSGSLLWAPGKPSSKKRDCVACTANGCYDEKCEEQKKVHKCKFSELHFMRMQGLCEDTGLGKFKVKVRKFFSIRNCQISQTFRTAIMGRCCIVKFCPLFFIF
jgi:hypothetical protein